MSAPHSHSTEHIVINALFLIMGLTTFAAAFYQYWWGDMAKAVFWLVFAAGCEVSIIRRNTDV